jgi:hypothetical protein
LSFDLKVAKQSGQGYAEGGRHFRDVLKAEIALAALDCSHEGSMNSAFVGKGFLGIAALGAQFSYPLPQGSEQVLQSGFHSNEFSGSDALTSTVFA